MEQSCLFWIYKDGLKRRSVCLCVWCSQLCLTAGVRIIKTDRHTARRGQCDGQNPPSLSVSHEEWEGEQSCEGSQVSLSPSTLTRWCNWGQSEGGWSRWVRFNSPLDTKCSDVLVWASVSRRASIATAIFTHFPPLIWLSVFPPITSSVWFSVTVFLFFKCD